MLISRRALLTSGAGAVWGRSLAIGQSVAPPFSIEMPDLELYPGAPTFVAVNTSGYTSCEVAILDFVGVVRTTSKKWSTEPGVSNGQALGPLKTAGDSRYPVKHIVKVAMQPTRAATPSMAMAVTQADLVSAAAAGLAGQGRSAADADAERLERTKQMAARARFVDDPARPPGGRFIAALATDSSIQLKIWKGETGRGKPIYQADFKNLSPGDHPIPWDLTTAGGPVQTGRYVGLLLCVPLDKRLKPTNLVASFGVTVP